MKRLILALGFMLLSSLANANDGVIKSFEIETRPKGETVAGAICIDGYKFAFIIVYAHKAAALVQIFEVFNGFANPPQPVRCK